MGLLTILITTLNRVEILRDCVDAIYSSNDLNWVEEVIIVDDGSTDDTLIYTKQLQKEGKVSKIIRNEKTRGPATARNHGVRAAKGEYTLIMGDDIILFPSSIRLFCEHIQRFGLHNASVIGNTLPSPNNLTAFEYWSCNGGSQFGHYKIPDENKFDACDEYYYTCNVVTPTAVLKEHPFDESFLYARYEDRELSYRLKKKINHKIHYLAEAKSYHQHKLPFKEWLQKFEKFTWAALHFSNIYPKDMDLKRKLGIEKAFEMETFQFDALDYSVKLINNYHKHFFDSEEKFGQTWIREMVTTSFRNLQEFFRLNYYRKHLKIPVLISENKDISALEAMDLVLDKLNDNV